MSRCAIPGLPNDTFASQGAWHEELLKRNIPYDDDNGYSQCSYYVHGDHNALTGEKSVLL